MKEEINRMLNDLSINKVKYIPYSIIEDMVECVSIVDSISCYASNPIYCNSIKKLKPFFLDTNNFEKIGIAINEFQYLANLYGIKIYNTDFLKLKSFLYEKYIDSTDLPTTIEETYQIISNFESICEKYGIEKPTFYVNDSIIENKGYKFIMLSDVKSNDTYKVIFTKNDFIIRNKVYKPKFVPYYITSPIMEQIRTTLDNLMYYNDFVK